MPLTQSIRRYTAMLNQHIDRLNREDALGIEIEYENVEWSGPRLTHWTVTGDGSLRDSGGEFVSAPLRFDATDIALSELEPHVSSGGFVASYRCGLHTHMNMRPYTVGQVWSLATLYALIEPTVYDQYAVGREDNSFAVPMYLNDHQVRCLYTDINNLRSGHSHNCAAIGTSKYSGLNFHRLHDLGTLEMRQPYSTTDFDAIRSWIDFCKRLVQQGTAHTDPHQVLDLYERGGLEGLQESLFGDTFPIDAHVQELAEDAAYYVGGYREPQWTELEWEVA